jgi:hypothetical protein
VRAGEAIAELRRCRELPWELRLESDCDQRVERVVRGLMLAGAGDVARFRREAAGDDVDLLLTWVDRASSLAVRRRDPDLLVAAIFAFGFAGSAERPEEWVHLQSQLRQAARIIARDPGDAWSAAIDRSDPDGAVWLDANRGRRRFLRPRYAVEQFSDPYDGGRFRFGPRLAPSDRVPVHDGRPDLGAADGLRDAPRLRADIERLVERLWRAGRRTEADRVLHAALVHDATGEAIDEVHAVLSQMDDTQPAAPLLERLAAR